MTLKIILISLSICILGSRQSIAAESLPLWEAGAGLLAFRSNHYRGSPQSRWRYFPVGVFTYRGKYIEAENGYVRGHFLRSKKFTLDLSLALGLNVNSDSDNLRKGMRDLDPTFEAGPILRYYFWKSESGNQYLNFELPYRAVYTTNLKYIDHIGYYSVPYLNFLSKGTDKTAGWATEIALGVQYGSSSYHNHFYGVDTKDVKTSRPYYHATAGYSGTQISVAVSRRIDNLLIVPFFRYDYLDGAVYNDSSLYKNPHYTFFGINLIWFLAQSKKYQEAPTMVK